jgi:hypothetical protein
MLRGSRRSQSYFTIGFHGEGVDVHIGVAVDDVSVDIGV